MYQENKNNGTEVLIPNARKTDLGAFVIGNLKLKKLKFQAGIRGDVRKINTQEMLTPDVNFVALTKNYKGLTFSGGTVYKIRKSKLRCNVSNGFRAPNTSELLSNGIQPGTNRYVIGDVNFKNENATQFDLSFDYEVEHFKFTVNPFFNRIQNYIYLAPTNTIIDSTHVFKYYQTSAILYGGEVGFHYHPHHIHWLHIESYLSNVIAEDNNGNALPLIPQTKISTTLKAELQHEGKIQLKNVFIQNIYKLNQDRIGFFETATNSYSLINAGLNIKGNAKKIHFEVTTGVKNILNVQYVDHLSRMKQLGIQNPGINYYITLKINLSKKL